jgi:hypothetical protein
LKPTAAADAATGTGTTTGDGRGTGAACVAATGVDGVGLVAFEGVEAVEDGAESKGIGGGRTVTEGV